MKGTFLCAAVLAALTAAGSSQAAPNPPTKPAAKSATQTKEEARAAEARTAKASEPKDAAASGAKASSTAVPAAPVVSPEASQTIEKIMKDREALITGKHFTYDPGGRRDPFRSLVEQVRKERGQRPRGIRGMTIGEIDLVGVIKKPGGNIAFFNGSDNRGYFLKIGDELFDGRLIAIDPKQGTVTFRQQVDDPRQIKPYRDIIKRLVPLEQEDAHESGG